MEFLPDFGLDAGNRGYHDETTALEPQSGFQGEVAPAAIRGEQTLVESSQLFDVHANKIKQWKDQLLEGMTAVSVMKRRQNRQAQLSMLKHCDLAPLK